MIFDVARSCITSGRYFESCNKPWFTSLKQNQSIKADNFTEWQPYYTHPVISCTHVCIGVNARARESSFLILLGMRSDLSSLTLNSHSLTPSHTQTHRCATGNQWNYDERKQQYPGEQSRDLQTKEDLQLNFLRFSYKTYAQDHSVIE